MLDFQFWDKIFSRYVNKKGLVNYQAWQQESQQEFDKELIKIAQTKWPEQLDTNEELATWINLYNIFMIATILERYPLESIRSKILGIANYVGFFWLLSRSVHNFAGQRYSLNQIEHQILRKRFSEPRIHFALVCASVGCPLLRQGAYFPHLVREQLEEDARRFINNPDKVHLEEGNNILYCSKIFKWYKQDFLQVSSSLPSYINNYLSSTQINLRQQWEIEYLPYDWSLNKQH